jgi:hypothetical protein
MTENLNEQEQIKDPNQLDMFEGILFTPEQEQKIAEFIKIREDIANTNESINNQREQLLTNNGFIKDVDFVNTFKVETVTREMTFGYTYNNTDFRAEVEFKQSTGSIGLKGKLFGSYSAPNELSDSTFSIEFEGNKVNCSTIQDNYRYIKPVTLLEKLKTFNSRQEQLFEEYKKKNSLKQSVVDKYTKLYPNTTITVKNEWSKYSGTFDVIEVQFESGSFVQFRLDTHKNIEYIHKKHDAEFEKMNSEELLERFSKQVKKEGSN